MWGVFYDADAPMKRVVIRRVFLGVFMDRFMDFTAHHHYAMSEGRVGGLGGGRAGALCLRGLFFACQAAAWGQISCSSHAKRQVEAVTLRSEGQILR